ncbi:MAG: hypothetical protein HN427_07525 [Flavobacteriales bacterium]|jgi:predicted permease|nr:hypothetical protein [Flavobacteriales bacterium]MBT7482012.1 hypothetical protein [Flavobacteriales bacterium]
MKNLLFIFITLITFTNVSYASFPVPEYLEIASANYADDVDIAETIVNVLGLLLMIFGLYFLIKSYKDTYNPWIKYLKLFGIIFISLFLLIIILCGPDGGCLSFSGG